ncbi:MAG: tRNA pseudouridine(55) synthase TruB [Coriobacteriia bacterium]|nr:tRNA pseudouridine(55) synthase TruB [Coriobacteriia bacterium]
MSKRGATSLCGILPLDKPLGMTSHDVVNVVRRATGERRVGHAGTLDPLATGLLVVLVGPMTRLARFFTDHPKTYHAAIAFGSETDTDDAEGEVVRTAEVPAALADETEARRALAGLIGPQEQTPPAYSAVRLAGRRAYEIARRGGEARLRPRSVEVYEAELLGVEPGPPLVWHAELTVTSGTYVRALARDLGRRTGTAAHLGGLVRTASGGLGLAGALTLEDVAQAGRAGRVAELFADPVVSLGLPAVSVDARAAARVAAGASLDADALRCSETDVPDGGYAAIVAEAHLVAVHRRQGDTLSPAVVLPSPASAPEAAASCGHGKKGRA